MSAVRCRSWRPLPGAGVAGEVAPGGKRRQWIPCRNRVGDGQVRCDQCWDELIAHPNPAVRLAAVGDANVPVDVLRALAKDSDITVSTAANHAIAERGMLGG